MCHQWTTEVLQDIFLKMTFTVDRRDDIRHRVHAALSGLRATEKQELEEQESTGRCKTLDKKKGEQSE